MGLTHSLVSTTLNGTSLIAPRAAGRLSLRLFRNLSPRSKIRDGEQETHDRARRDQLSVNGKRVVTYQWGDGTRPVLLVHGWHSRAARFAAIVSRLEAAGYSPIAFDAPGNGASGGYTTTILEYQDAIRQSQNRYGPFEAVVAHSFGVLASLLALRGGLIAGRLVAVAGVSHFEFLVDEFSRRLALNPRLRQELRQRVERELFPDVPDLWTLFDGAHRTNEISLPMLVIHDDQDTTVPIGQSHRLAAAYADRLRLVTTTGLGHRAILFDPAVVDQVVEYVQRRDLTPAGTTVRTAPPSEYQRSDRR